MADIGSRKPSMVWRILGWIWLAVGFAIGIWWLFHLPSAGYGGLTLAMGATLMPLVWEKVRVLCKMGWIAMLFVLLAVEYRAIDEDRRRSSDELTKKFGEVSEQANQNLKKILDDEHLSFTKLLQAEDKRFSQTMTAILRTQRQNEQEFAALLKQQRGLFEQQQEMTESLNGHLIPSNDPMPSLESLGCRSGPLQEDEYLIITGGLTSIVKTFPYPVLTAFGRRVISFSKSDSGALVLSMDIRDSDDTLIARFDEDGFEVNPHLLKRHPDKSTLIVEDTHGNQVMKARYSSKRVFTLEGKLSLGGRLVTIPYIHFQQSCFRGVANAITIN